MKLYAICWQDDMEPWGWAPAVEPSPSDRDPDDPPQAFYWDRDEAHAALDAHLDRLAPDYQRAFNATTLKAARDAIARQWSVQEYDVPPPPGSAA